MSEYNFVDKPFLDQLAALGWAVIDQGTGVPTDPTKSLRANFREVLLRSVFRDAVRSINLLPDGESWLTDRQLDELHDQIALQPSHSILEANEAVLKLPFRAQVDQNEVTGEEYSVVPLIDFEHPERNRFHAINQFRIDTPGTDKECIIPDIVLFVNGLPLVVVECKDANAFTSNPMEEAFKQLMRYSDQRPETKVTGLREGEPRLFHTNQLLSAQTVTRPTAGRSPPLTRNSFSVEGHPPGKESRLHFTSGKGTSPGDLDSRHAAAS